MKSLRTNNTVRSVLKVERTYLKEKTDVQKNDHFMNAFQQCIFSDI